MIVIVAAGSPTEPVMASPIREPDAGKDRDMTRCEHTADEILLEVERHIQAACNGARIPAEVLAGLSSARRDVEVIIHQDHLEIDQNVRAEVHAHYADLDDRGEPGRRDGEDGAAS